jgi:HK97 family phage major capsid protein
MEEETGQTILGYPVVVVGDSKNEILEDNIILGDFSHYVLVEINGEKMTLAEAIKRKEDELHGRL